MLRFSQLSSGLINPTRALQFQLQGLKYSYLKNVEVEHGDILAIIIVDTKKVCKGRNTFVAMGCETKGC